MGKDTGLALVTVTRTLAKATMGFVASYVASGEIEKGKLENLRIQIRQINAIRQAGAINDVAAKHVDVIANIQAKIDERNLEGPALAYAMKQLELAAAGLENSMREMSGGRL